MEKNNSNILVKTMILVLFIALSCVIFFGFMEGNKTAMEYTAFGLVLFALLIVYITSIVAKNRKKLNSSDIFSFGILYFLTNIITNIFCFNMIGNLKMLILINSIEVIIILIIICMVILKKK